MGASMNDRKGWKLHGPARTLRADFAEWDAARGEWQPLRAVSGVTFRPEGQLSGSEYHNSDGSLAREERVYSATGQLLESQW
jgi:hypothetical protein